MEVILLERIEKLGQMGDVVNVKAGFARNYLLPQNKALRKTKQNLTRFESQRAQLEAENLTKKTEAEKIADKLKGQLPIGLIALKAGVNRDNKEITKDLGIKPEDILKIITDAKSREYLPPAIYEGFAKASSELKKAIIKDAMKQRTFRSTLKNFSGSSRSFCIL